MVVTALVVLVGAGWWYYSGTGGTPTPTPTPQEQPISTATFACDAGKSVVASFYNARVSLKLSDTRSQELPQAQSASGVRYANADETFVFWNKGNTAFITEGANQDQTFTGCILVAPDASGVLTQVYATSTAGFSIRFPQGFVFEPNYTYQALGPKKGISGVKITIPESATAGTNLSKDTYLSVEWLPKATDCVATAFIDSGNKPPKAATFTDAGVDYSVATTTGVGAGNIYDEAVFAIPGSSPCTAVRYFIHSSNIANYPKGTVKEFDKAGLISVFDAIRRTLVFGR